MCCQVLTYRELPISRTLDSYQQVLARSMSSLGCFVQGAWDSDLCLQAGVTTRQTRSHSILRRRFPVAAL